MTSAALKYWPFELSNCDNDSGTSREAEFLHEQDHRDQSFLQHSEALSGIKNEALEQIMALQRECNTEDWDGYGGLPITNEVVMQVNKFIGALSPHYDMPEAAPEPDGEIALEWACSKNKLFSVSIGEDNRFSFAWLDGEEHGYGVAVFDGNKIPKKIIEGIQGITG